MATITQDYEELERLREAICIYMREEDQKFPDEDWDDENPDQQAIDWFCDQYSERNYE